MTGRWPAVSIFFGLVLGAGPVAATDLDDFARCLGRAGATYYTASWCPHRAHQDQMFGSSLRYLRTVDCTSGCRDAGVSSFPTWMFADGSRLSGVASLAVLGSRTGCRLGGSRSAPSGHDAGARAWSGFGTR